jgi:peroxiredoxin
MTHFDSGRAVNRWLIVLPLFLGCMAAWFVGLASFLGPASLVGPAFTSVISRDSEAPFARRPVWTGNFLDRLLPAAAAQELVPGSPAPAFSLRALTSDRTVSLTELLVEKSFTMLVFWNSDCSDCLEALEDCERFAGALDSAGAKMVGVNHDVENIASIRSFLKNRNITFPQLWDSDRLVAASYGTGDYSFSLFLIDSSGTVREAFYDCPAEAGSLISEMLERYGKLEAGKERTEIQVGAGTEAVAPSTPTRPSRLEGEMQGEESQTALAPGRPTIAADQVPGSHEPKLSVTGDVRVRVMNICTDHDPDIPAPPTGPYGEIIREGLSQTHRAQIELSGRITNSLTAGTLIRLSNEDDDVIKFGPQYFSRREGSAYVQYRENDFSLRLGYFDTHFTPLSLMRWDAQDNPRTGGTSTGCATCAGATGAILLESLEELGPELTFEGASLQHAVGELMDVTAFYARPAAANEISMGEFLANSETLDDFAYRRDLFGLRANLNVNHPALANPALMSLHVLRTRDDHNSATFVGSIYDPRGFALDNRVYGALLSVPLHKRIWLEVELDRTETYDNVLDPIDTAEWGTGYLTTVRGDIPGGVDVSLSYLSLTEDFQSSFAALSYVPNRKGVRAGLNVRRGRLSSDVFVKFLEPYGDVAEVYPSPFQPSTRSQFKNHLTAGLWLSSGVCKGIELGGGWLMEREMHDVYRYTVEPSSGVAPRDLARSKNTFTLQLVSAFSPRSWAELLYQYMHYTDEIESMNDYSAHRTSLQFSTKF